jgi:hypothetical protein
MGTVPWERPGGWLGPGLRSQHGLHGGERPVQRGPGVCQLPGEPGALRGGELRAAGGHWQEGSPRGPQLVQGHLQCLHVVEDSGHPGQHRERQGRAGFWTPVSLALGKGGPSLKGVLAASRASGPRWRSRPGLPVLEMQVGVFSTCARKTARTPHFLIWNLKALNSN